MLLPTIISFRAIILLYTIASFIKTTTAVYRRHWSSGSKCISNEEKSYITLDNWKNLFFGKCTRKIELKYSTPTDHGSVKRNCKTVSIHTYGAYLSPSTRRMASANVALCYVAEKGNASRSVEYRRLDNAGTADSEHEGNWVCSFFAFFFVRGCNHNEG